jgi:transcriptional regulator with XRE-family HTH domain
LTPLSDGGPGDAEVIRQFSETAATASDDGETGHAVCLPEVSGRRKGKMLTQRQQSLGQNAPMEIGHKIKAARIEAGIESQRRFADALKVSNGLVGAWENHTKTPGRDNLVKIAKATGKPLSYFIGDALPDNSAVLETKDPDEIELVTLFRAFSSGQRSTHLQLFRESAALRAEIEAQSKPAKGKRITA